MGLDAVHFRGGYNFLGLPEEDTRYENAHAVILPVPYDSTTSYKAGTREGPLALILASRNVELYDLELECEPLISGIHTLPELEPDMRGPEVTVRNIQKAVEALVKDGKFPVVLGGEHSITTAPVRVLAKKYGADFSVLQLDAHADLRESFENTPFNHASVMRRVRELCPVTQVGIRNISAGEMEYVRQSRHKTIFWAHDLQGPAKTWIPSVVKTLKKKVYITIDLDAFDPAVCPGVGTPEPGGLTWYPTLELLQTVIRTHDVVGIDIMELCPIAGSIVSDFFAAKLLFKLLAEVFAKNHWIGE
ncbi:MAG TPA: agmatinase [Candidatus Ozemobacteraceae bacterium]|nr:agmatinase [Candidatus Ozemobacteraceae bacterium]